MSGASDSRAEAEWRKITTYSAVAGFALGQGDKDLARFIASLAVTRADRMMEAGREEGSIALLRLEEALATEGLGHDVFADARTVRQPEIDGAGRSLLLGLPFAASAQKALGALAMKVINASETDEPEEDA